MCLSRPELIKKEIGSIAEYVPGKSIDEIAGKYGLDPSSIIKLGSNENVLGPSSLAVNAMMSVTSGINLYPSADAMELVDALSVYTGLPVENICASGPGMDGLLDNLMRLILSPGDEVIVPTPTFSYYEIASRANGACVSYVLPGEKLAFDIRSIKESITDRTKVIFLCSPNNPTGKVLEEAVVRDILGSVNCFVFVDEAYVEFADNDLSHLVTEYDNIIVGRTFSKVFGLAGLRIGYGLMPAWLKEQYMKVSTPFNVNLPALKAGVAALSDKAHLQKSIECARSGRDYLKSKIPFTVHSSQANFVLVDVAPMSARTVAEYLLAKGIIVRDCTSFRNAGNSLLRITVGNQHQNEKVVAFLKEIKAKIKM